MAFAALLAGTLAGVAAALVATFGLDLGLPAALVAWWAVGTGVTLLPMAVLMLRSMPRALPQGILPA